ncbi:uncharacterized protein LOC118433286 [Folsomia candida]|uniref:uncharacterized protein LOC118433286 n=1 Tax=Folsomia candida TaxID=158441 RepID=UPI00160558F0|nr:uncharacterized protein LOC118433286 [Folsomia candida]
MLFSRSIRYVKVQLNSLSLFGLDLACYNSDLSEFQPVRKASRFLNLKIFLVFATTGGIVLNGGYTLVFLPVDGISHKIFILMFISAFTTGMCVVVPLLLRPLNYISLLNIQLKMEAGLFKKLEVPPIWKFCLEICHISAVISSIAVPAAVTVFALYDPTHAPYLGSLVRTSTNSCRIVKTIIHVALLLLQGWDFMIITNIFCIMVVQIFFGMLIFIAAFLSALTRSIKGRQLSIQEHFRLYRGLKILTSRLNFLFRGLILPAILLYAISCNVLGTYLTVSINSGIFEELRNAVFPLFAVETGLTILVLGRVGGLIHKRSKKCVLLLGRDKSRMAKSCHPLKIKFGTNFIDSSTPLVIICFCAKNTARLLLLEE